MLQFALVMPLLAQMMHFVYFDSTVSVLICTEGPAQPPAPQQSQPAVGQSASNSLPAALLELAGLWTHQSTKLNHLRNTWRSLLGRSIQLVRVFVPSMHDVHESINPHQPTAEVLGHCTT